LKQSEPVEPFRFETGRRLASFSVDFAPQNLSSVVTKAAPRAYDPHAGDATPKQ
jgi:hypothetical protein